MPFVFTRISTIPVYESFAHIEEVDIFPRTLIFLMSMRLKIKKNLKMRRTDKIKQEVDG